MTVPFGARLHAAVAARGPLCAGIDPHAALLDAWGLTDDVAGLERFALAADGGARAARRRSSSRRARSTSASAAAASPSSSGSSPPRATPGALVLLDVKRGDIGSTSQAYADAYLDPASPLAADAVTASPYLGFGSLDPMIDTARRHGAGVFVLALTSNKEGPEVQHADRSDGGDRRGPGARPAARAQRRGRRRSGSFGAVVGATLGELPADVDLAINGPLLAPGYGAQGGTAADLRRIFGRSRRARCWRAPAATCSGTDPTPAGSPTPPAAPTTTCAACDGVSAGPWPLLLVARPGRRAAPTGRSSTAARSGPPGSSSESCWPSGGDAALLEALAAVPRARRRGAHRHRGRVERCVIDRIEALGDALAAAGVDPATYDAEQPPAGLDDAEKTAITDAARDLGARGDPARARRSGAAGARRLPDAAWCSDPDCRRSPVLTRLTGRRTADRTRCSTRTDRDSSVALPPLTPEQRQAALDKAAASRRERAEVKNRLKNSGASIVDVLHEGHENDVIGKMRVIDLLQSMPGLGKVRARQLMERLGIAESRRVRGLGTKQVAALEREFGARD